MIRKTQLIVAVASIGLSTGTLLANPVETPAAVAPTAPTTRPATDAAQERIKQLIAELADPSFSVRDKACQELMALGDSAMPALHEAVKSDDPSIRSYAEHLVKRQEKRNQPAPPQQLNRATGRIRGVGPGGLVINNNGGRLVIGDAVQRAIRVNVQNGVKNTHVTENGRTINISERPEGIEIEVVAPVDGKDQKTTYAAKNVEELKEKHPEGFKIYQQHGNRAGRIQIQNGVMQLEGALRLDNLDAIKRLERELPVFDLDVNVDGFMDLQRNMEQIKVNRQQIHEQLREIEGMQRKMMDDLRLELRRNIRAEPLPEVRDE